MLAHEWQELELLTERILALRARFHDARQSRHVGLMTGLQEECPEREKCASRCFSISRSGWDHRPSPVGPSVRRADIRSQPRTGDFFDSDSAPVNLVVPLGSPERAYAFLRARAGALEVELRRSTGGSGRVLTHRRPRGNR